MRTDGQLYDVLHKGERGFPPPGPECAPPRKKPFSFLAGVEKDELIILGVMLLLLRDSEGETDLPLLLALVYILLA